MCSRRALGVAPVRRVRGGWWEECEVVGWVAVGWDGEGRVWGWNWVWGLGWGGIRTFEEGGEVIDIDVLSLDTFEEVEKDLGWVLVNGVGEEREGWVELPCGGSRGPRSGSEVSGWVRRVLG